MCLLAIAELIAIATLHMSYVIADPDPRLEMVIVAARRGATVRVLLDSFFDDAKALRSNRATVDYLNVLAQTEGLDLQARTGNSTGGGIHMKLVLVQVRRRDVDRAGQPQRQRGQPQDQSRSSDDG